VQRAHQQLERLQLVGRDLRRQLLHQAVRGLLCLLQADAGPQADEAAHPTEARLRVEVEGEGPPGVEPLREAGLAGQQQLEVRGEDADHLRRLPVEDDRTAHDAGVAAEALLPQPVAQQQDGRRVRQPVSRGERAADERLDAQDVKEVPADAADPELHGIAHAGQRSRVVAYRGHVLEDAGALAQVLDLWRRERGQRRLPVAHHPDERQPLRLAIGQVGEQHAADHAEHRGVDGDAERERHDGDEREAGPRP
jgi:hypothetical protein